MFRFLLGVFFGAMLGALGMAYLWWQDDQQRAEASYPQPPSNPPTPTA